MGGAWKLEAKSKRLPASSEASAAAALAGSRGRAEPPPQAAVPPPPPAALSAPSPPSASSPPPHRQTAPGHLGPGFSAKVPAVAGVGSAGRGGDPGPGASAPFREEF